MKNSWSYFDEKTLMLNNSFGKDSSFIADFKQIRSSGNSIKWDLQGASQVMKMLL